MGRLFLIEFDDSTDYWQCKMCRTPIALSQYGLGCFHDELRDEYIGVFRKVANVRVDKPLKPYQLDSHIVVDIFCVQCGDLLGIRIIGRAEFVFLGETHVMEDGMVALLLAKVSWMDLLAMV